MFTAQEDVMMTASGSNNYSGCFICGDKGHGFRDCPKRAGQQPPPAKGHRKGTYWVESMTPTSLSSVFMLQPEDEKEIKNTDGWGVLDIGATETVASLEALERLLELRRQFHEPAADELRVVPHGRKPFRFGNGEVQHSESFVLLKQQVGERKVYLGLYTLMVSRVPILVGMKTLVKLGAVIDVKGQWMVLSAISPDLKIPLKRSVSGHLLVDLTKDWLDGSQPLFFSEDSMSARVYMVQAAAEDDDMQHEAVRFPGEDSSLCENLPVETSQHSEPPANMSCEVDADVVHGEDLQNEEDDNFTVMMATSNDDGACPVAQVDQQMRDRVLGALSRPSSSNLICHGAQDHQEGQPSAIDGALRLEPSMRPFGVGPTDSGASLQRRTCGSSDGSRHVSGANKFGRWVGCLHCNLRLSYVPTWGSPGDQRKAGPLPSDIQRQLNDKKPPKGSVELKEKKITMDAVERSLEDQLNKVRQKKKDYMEKEALKNQTLSGYPQGKEPPAPKDTSSGSNRPAVKEEMSQTPGRKTRRAEDHPEDLEYQGRAVVISDDEWDKVTNKSP